MITSLHGVGFFFIFRIPSLLRLDTGPCTRMLQAYPRTHPSGMVGCFLRQDPTKHQTLHFPFLSLFLSMYTGYKGGAVGLFLAVAIIHAVGHVEGSTFISTETQIYAAVGLFLSFSFITFTFGDHIQARWALLPVLVSVISGVAVVGNLLI